MSDLVIRSLVSGYGGVPIVQGVTLQAREASLTGIVGPNGCGKSTLLKAVAGLLKLEGGSVHLDGFQLNTLPAHQISRLGVGYVPQTRNIFPSLTIEENLEVAGVRMTRKQTRARLADVIDYFPELAASRKRRAEVLSGGQRNALGVARALMLSPKALLVDEPTAGLAPQNRQVVWDQLLRVADSGVSVLVVEQNVDALLRHAAFCYVLVGGRIVLEGPAAELDSEALETAFLGGIGA
jgi:branched-chain amino acid transport system ATP-binding protein